MIALSNWSNNIYLVEVTLWNQNTRDCEGKILSLLYRSKHQLAGKPFKIGEIKILQFHDTYIDHNAIKYIFSKMPL